jgi:uncharacterized RDD family membrane protein YckC
LQEDRISIEVPEQVELKLDVAGLGSRFCAALIDSLILIIASLLGFFSLNPLIGGGAVGSWIAAIAILIFFFVSWGYYIIFEMVWNGGSPGKRAFKLRVVKRGGYPITLVSSTVRNLMRIVDFLPLFYSVGILTMMIDKNWRRLGDLAAGTLVIKEHKEVDQSELIIPVPQREKLLYEEKIQADKVTEEEIRAIGEYIRRRSGLPPEVRRRLARSLAIPLLQRMSISGIVDYEIFLEEVLIITHRR